MRHGYPNGNLTFGFQPGVWLLHVGGYPRFWFPMVSRLVWGLVSALAIANCMLARSTTSVRIFTRPFALQAY